MSELTANEIRGIMDTSFMLLDEMLSDADIDPVEKIIRISDHCNGQSKRMNEYREALIREIIGEQK